RSWSAYAGTADLPGIIEIGEAVHQSIAWLFTNSVDNRSISNLIQVYESCIQSESPRPEVELVMWGEEILRRFFKGRFETESSSTVATESEVAMHLTTSTTLVGRLDRLSITPAGEMEVTEFKLHETRRGSRPRIPDLLQPAAYAAAEMEKNKRSRIFAELYFIDENISERILLTENGARAVKLALSRWIESLKAKGLEANPGVHCRRCSYRGTCPYSLAA
ncbi:MAG TPA: PD-(D/E)XK nuclease family protein, partial [Steroidobacteraceae bacterium]|nr:PD-(D/E)XK nuclease family protein [Steroidobacteraceae bacterium]